MKTGNREDVDQSRLGVLVPQLLSHAAPGIQQQGIHDSGPSAVERGGSLPDPGLEPLWERGATGDGAAPLDQEQTLGPDPRLGILDPPSGYPNAGSGCISGADRPANRDDAMAPSPNRRGQTYSPV